MTEASSGLPEYQAVWAQWTALWNGDDALNDTLISPDFIAHAAPISGSGDGLVRGREGLAGWITGIRPNGWRTPVCDSVKPRLRSAAVTQVIAT